MNRMAGLRRVRLDHCLARKLTATVGLWRSWAFGLQRNPLEQYFSAKGRGVPAAARLAYPIGTTMPTVMQISAVSPSETNMWR